MDVGYHDLQRIFLLSQSALFLHHSGGTFVLLHRSVVFWLAISGLYDVGYSIFVSDVYLL
jgi:hypothetical protein